MVLNKAPTKGGLLPFQIQEEVSPTGLSAFQLSQTNSQKFHCFVEEGKHIAFRYSPLLEFFHICFHTYFVLLCDHQNFTFIGLPFYHVFAPHFALIYTQNSENSAQPLTRFPYDVSRIGIPRFLRVQQFQVFFVTRKRIISKMRSFRVASRRSHHRRFIARFLAFISTNASEFKLVITLNHDNGLSPQ